MLTSLLCGEVSERIDQTRWRYSEVGDYHVVHRAQRGDYPATEFLLSKYRTLVRNKASSYFLVGAESEDLVQVGMIGLWQAIVDFRTDRAVSFHAFANVCIVNHMISAIKTAARFKQNPLNMSVSLEAPIDNSSAEITLADALPSDAHGDPEETLLTREDTRLLKSRLHELLSEFEWRVLSCYRIGKSYREIAEELLCNTKSIDNALTRIKHKVSTIPLGLADLSRVV